MNYFPFHIGDYAVHTRHLSLMEDLAYRRCLDLYYTREHALPADPAQVARLIGMREHVADVEAVLKEFFVPEEHGDWVHARCEAEIRKANEAAERARTNGKAGGRPVGTKKEPSGNPQKTQPVISGNPEESKSKAPNTQDQSQDQTNTPLPPEGVDGFTWFWNSWPKHPRKVAEKQCREKWAKKECEPIARQIVEHVEAMKRSEGWLKDKGQFIPAPLVYLNQERWRGATDTEEIGEWHETQAGVEKKAVALGLPKWDQKVQYSEYKARVVAAAGAQA